jgi:hypothetical protein
MMNQAAFRPQQTRQPSSGGQRGLGMQRPAAAAAPKYPPGQRPMSHDPMSFKSYILYVIPEDRLSQRAQEIAAKFNDVHVQNILQIPPQRRPAWLNGAPILVSLQTNKAYKGTQAFHELNRFTQGQDFQNRAGKGYDNRTGHSTERTCSSGCEIVPLLDDDSKYLKSGKLTDDDINAYLSRRERSGKYRPGGDQVVPPI